MIEKLNRKDIYLFVMAAVVIAISLVIIQRYFRQAFPEAAIEFKITKEEAKEQAEAFLKNRQWEVEGYRHASVFNYYGRQKTFLERHLDPEEAGRIFNEINGWRWYNRWFKPEHKEEFRVAYSTRGELTYFEHIIPEEAPGDSLGQDVARDIAEFYLVGFLGWNPDEWGEVKALTEDKPNRRDHKFTWERKGFEIEEGTHRISVQISGSEVSRYEEWLEVPEAWEREYARLRSKNNLADNVASILLGFAVLAIIIIILLRMRLRDIRWKTAYVYGLVFAILLILNELNSLPLKAYWFDTRDSNLTYILQIIVFNVILNPLLNGLFIAVLLAGAETMYRDRYPRQIALRNLLTQDGLKTRSFMTSALVGISLTVFTLAFQTVFYLMATNLGAWSPTQVPDINRLGTFIPWAAVLFGGFAPALIEETISRMFSIPFLQKYARSTVLAIFVSALIWGFAHASYPAQPFFIRGVEVGIIGILIGVIFLRFGFLAVIIWHFSLDAVYSAIVLVRSGNPYYIATAIVCAGVVIIPLIYAIVSYIRTGGFIASDYLTNAADKTPTPLKEAEIARLEKAKIDADFKPLSSARKTTGYVIAVAGVIAMLLPVKEELRDLVRYEIDRQGAVNIARGYLEQFGFDLSGYRVAAVTESKLGGRGSGQESDAGGPGKSAAVYLFEKGGVDAVAWTYTHHVVPSEWRVRFFKPLEKEEYDIFIDPRGSGVSGHSFLIADSTYLPSVSSDSAEVMIRHFLADRGHDLNQFELLRSERIKQVRRTDHVFAFQSTAEHPGSVGKSRLLFHVTVHGDRVGHYNRGIKLPEEWLRAYKKETPATVAREVILVICIIGSILISLVALFKLMKHSKPSWRPVLLSGLGFIALVLISRLNESAGILVFYPTSVPLGTYVFDKVFLDVITGLLFTWFFVSLALVSVQLMHPEAFYAFSRRNRRVYIRDALPAAAIGLGACLLSTTVGKIMHLKLPASGLDTSLRSPRVAGFAPSIELLMSIFTWSIVIFMATVVARYLFRRYVTGGIVRQGLIAVVLLILVSIVAAGDESAGIFSKWAWNFVWFGSLLLIWYFFWRRNPLSYLLGPLAAFCFLRVWSFWSMTGSVYRVHAWITVIAVSLVFAFLMLGGRREERA